MIDAPLECKIENEELVIKIGIGTMVFAVQKVEPFTAYDEKIGDFRVFFHITDMLEFAKGIQRELLREEEDGSSPLTNLLDLASASAAEQGDAGIEEV